jgi:hypothetical protein
MTHALALGSHPPLTRYKRKTNHAATVLVQHHGRAIERRLLVQCSNFVRRDLTFAGTISVRRTAVSGPGEEVCGCKTRFCIHSTFEWLIRAVSASGYRTRREMRLQRLIFLHILYFCMAKKRAVSASSGSVPDDVL